jgi:hypothetical protein
MGGKRQTMRARQKKLQQSKKAYRIKKTYKGGYYPSIYGGVAGATILAPLAARQAYRLWTNWSGARRTTRKSIRKS